MKRGPSAFAFAPAFAVAFAFGPAFAFASAFALASCAPVETPAPATPVVAGAAHDKNAIAFIEDDYPHALAEAKAKHVPLFVDAWAPWCHSCLSMRSYVLSSPELSPLGGKMVFLAIDTEKPANAAFVGKFPNDVWPTLFVIDAESERAIVKWGGTATASELVAFLSDATSPSDSAAHADALAAFVQGNASVAAGDLAVAEAHYRDALSRATPGFRERPRIIEALVSVLHDRDENAACAELAKTELPSLPHGSSRATVLATALDCADSGKLDASFLLATARADLREEDTQILADDRSSLFDAVVDTLEKQGDSGSARAEAERWAAFLEREAGRAKTPAARAVFDPHRLLAYTAAGRERDAIGMLEQSLKDFPTDYNPKARLAKVYFDTHDLARARSYVDAAFKEVYGPRTLRIVDLAVNIAKAENKPNDAADFLRAAIERTQNLPLNPKQKKLLETRRRELSALAGKAASPSAE